MGSEGSSLAHIEKVSSNQFANGTNQNSGNILTDKPSTRLHHAPGGASSICLGSEGTSIAHIEKVSSNQFANGANQNSGNIITGRPSTRLHHALGGASSICLGSFGNENMDTTNVPQVQDAVKPVKLDTNVVKP